MNYSIDYLEASNIVCISVVGRMNFSIASKYSKEAVKIARQNNCKKFLFDHRYTTFRGRVINLHTSEDEFQQFGFKSTDIIAIVLQKQKTKSNFNDSINKNESWSIIKYFTKGDKSEAITWLAGD